MLLHHDLYNKTELAFSQIVPTIRLSVDRRPLAPTEAFTPSNIVARYLAFNLPALVSLSRVRIGLREDISDT